MNTDLTPEEIEAIKQEELEESLASKSKARALPINNSSKDYFSSNPSIPQPPSPELINGEELQRALENLSSVALAHEVALNKDFQLVRPNKISLLEHYLQKDENSPPSATTINKEAELALTAKDRYWVLIDRILLTKSFKVAKCAVMDLMTTLKTMLLSTLLPHNIPLRIKVNETLNLDKISHEIDQEQFDMALYMEFILDTLSALCCPLHDQELLEIRNIEVASRQIQECIELMELMNLDMANFVISQSRHHVFQNCVMYERANFANFLETTYWLGRDPLRIIRGWILRHQIPERSFSETMARCFAELLSYEDNVAIPETLLLDLFKFPGIRAELKRITLIAAVVSAVYDFAHALLMDSNRELPGEDNNNIDSTLVSDFEKGQITTLKNLRLLSKLRGEINTALTPEEFADPNKLNKALERCSEQAVATVDYHLVTETCKGLASEQKEQIVLMIKSLSNLQSPAILQFRKKL